MPSLGADMEAGTVTEWRVKPGDAVHRGDVVAVVETEKSTIEVEIFESGVVDEILVDAGERVPVGTVLARVTGAQAVPPPTPVPVAAVPVRAQPVPTTTAERPPPPTGSPAPVGLGAV